MKKQLLIMFNTLLLAFGISSCSKQTKNITDVKKSLNLNVVPNTLEENYNQKKPIYLFNFSTHRNDPSWIPWARETYERLDNSTSWDMLATFSDGKKDLEFSKKSIDLIYAGITNPDNAAKDWWIINSWDKFLYIHLIMKFIIDHDLLHKVKRIIVHKIRIEDSIHKHCQEFSIIDVNNKTHLYKRPHHKELTNSNIVHQEIMNKVGKSFN